MAKFSLNPLSWIKKKGQRSAAAPSSAALLKPAAQPRKNGKIFLHLITLQKSLQSMELALGQGIDTTWLVQKAAGQVSLLKLEAEALGEEELSQTAGQVLAYFETVAEGRLDLDKAGVLLVRDFITIFKDAIGDAAPGVRPLDVKKLEAWEASYQSLMAHMKPIEREVEVPDAEEAKMAEPEADSATASVAEELVEEAAPANETAFPVEIEEPAQISSQGFVEITDGSDQAVNEVAVDLEETRVEPEAAELMDDGLGDEEALEKIPLYDPSEQMLLRDSVIRDAEVKSAREFVEMGEPMPQVIPRDERAKARDTAKPPPSPGKIREDKEKIAQSPVQLEEVERLKRKLLELHEKQEMLSSKMSGILGGIKKAVQSDTSAQEGISVEKMDIDQLEDLIFIGRKKG